MLKREGYTQNKFEATGNPVPTMEGTCRAINVMLRLNSIFDTNDAEWTFAKQKWQRTKVSRGDIKHRTAEILPGWNEKKYDDY